MNTLESATRPIYWNIQWVWVMYVLLVPTFAIFFYGMYRRIRLWMIGRPTGRLDRWRERMAKFRAYVPGHQKLMRDRYSGSMHAFMFWGMMLLFLGTVVVAIHEDLRIPIMQGWFYLVFQSLVLDLVGAVFLVGLGMAVWKRCIRRAPRLQHNRAGVAPDRSDPGQLILFFLLLLQGFILEGMRIAGTNDPWAAWSPVGNAAAAAFRGMGEGALVGAYQFFWWFHAATAFAWIATLPWSKMLHLFTSAANVATSSLEPPGMALEPIDFEKTERLGVSAITDFTWKDLLDLDACTSCGRCQDACPAYAAGKPLSPKNLILDLRDYMRRHGEQVITGTAVDDLPPLVGAGGAIHEDTLWACTTCRACMEECPVAIAHVPKIVDMRRSLVMEKAEFPELLQEAARSMENRMHPFRGATATRTEWADGLDIPMLAGVEQADILYWVGCAGAFDPRNQKVARAFGRVLQEVGVSFAILGDEESCTGDPARRMGHEFLYDMMARANVELLNNYKPKFQRIVTACPHCLNQLANEYRALGGEYEVVHHSQFIKELMDQGKLRLDPAVAEQVTFHDPCYLGRYNGEYEAPREVIAAAGGQLTEMERSRSRSFCCGAGGAHAWMEDDHGGPRVNQLRAQEALDTGARGVCTACPFCLQMMDDGVKTQGGEDAGVYVKDLVELVAESLDRGKTTALSGD